MQEEIEVLSGQVKSGAQLKKLDEYRTLRFQKMVLEEKLRDMVRSYVFCDDWIFYRFLKKHYLKKALKLMLDIERLESKGSTLYANVPIKDNE